MTQLVDIAENRVKRLLDRQDIFETDKLSRKLTTSHKNNNTAHPSIVIVVPRDLYDHYNDLHQKTWRGERLKDGSILFRPHKS